MALLAVLDADFGSLEFQGFLLEFVPPAFPHPFPPQELLMFLDLLDQLVKTFLEVRERRASRFPRMEPRGRQPQIQRADRALFRRGEFQDSVEPNQIRRKS